MTKKKNSPGKGLKLAKVAQQQPKTNGAVRTAKKQNKNGDKPLYTLAKELSALLPAPFNFAARAATEGINAIRGFGDYEVTTNSLGIKGTAGAGVPSFSVPNSHRVVHRECLGTVSSPGPGFSIVKKLLVNPSDSNTFPWLSAIAKNYVSYVVHGMVFIYESNSSEYAATSGLGSVCLATRYDPRETDFSSFIEMQNSQFAISSKPSQNIIHPIECAPKFQSIDTFFVRRGNETETTYMYDKCKTYLGVEGLNAAAGTVIGRIWVTYDIEFKSPALTPAVPLSLGYQLRQLPWAPGTGKNVTDSIGACVTDPTRTTNSNLIKVVTAYSTDPSAPNAPMTINYVAKSVRFYKRGNYLIDWNLSGSSLSTASGGENIHTISFNGSGFGIAEAFKPSYNYSADMAQYTFWINVTGDGNGATDYVQVSFADLVNGSVAWRSANVAACC